MILHVGHTINDRDQHLANAWSWEAEYPLSDRHKLAALLRKVDIRNSSAQMITSKMPLPGERPFGQPHASGVDKTDGQTGHQAYLTSL